MRAITLIQPWPFAIAHLGKDIENRSWKPPAHVIGTRIAIHAGQKIDREALAMISLLAGVRGVPLGGLGHGAITSVATVAGYSAPGFVDPKQSKWRQLECFGWHLENVIALPEPVAATGALGLWTLTADQENAVTVQMCEALRAKGA